MLRDIFSLSISLIIKNVRRQFVWLEFIIKGVKVKSLFFSFLSSFNKPATNPWNDDIGRLRHYEP